MKHSLIFLLCIAFLLPPSAIAAPRVRSLVNRVIDGDTVEVIVDGNREPVRLIGIDCPESRPGARANKQAARSELDLKVILDQGQAATRYVTKLLPKRTVVYLESDVEKRDRYDRLLAYIFLEDGTHVNEQILRAGYAMLYTFPPNIRYNEKLRAAFEYARLSRAGLWEDE